MPSSLCLLNAYALSPEKTTVQGGCVSRVLGHVVRENQTYLPTARTGTSPQSPPLC